MRESLRGPAPLHHALLNGDKYAGVSLQTLDDKAFDHGAVLAQTPDKGIPIPENISLPDLTAQLADVGAELLVQGLREGVYIPPLKDVSLHAHREAELRHAPKLTKEQARIDWEAGQKMDSEALERRLKGMVNVFGSVWTEAVDVSGREKRVIFKDIRVGRGLDGSGRKKRVMKFVGGEERDVEVDEGTKRCLIHCGGDVWMDVGKVTVQGSPEKPAAAVLKGFMVKKKSG